MIHDKGKSSCSHSPLETMLDMANINKIYDHIRVIQRQEDGSHQCGDYRKNYASGQRSQHHEIFTVL